MTTITTTITSDSDGGYESVVTDAADIQSSLDALPAEGGVVDARGTPAATLSTMWTIPEGATLLLGPVRYTFTSAQMIDMPNDDSCVIGMGMGLTELFHDTNSNVAGTNLVDVQGDRTKVMHLEVDGNSANQSSGSTTSHGIYVSNASNAMEDVEIAYNNINNVEGRSIFGQRNISNFNVHNNRVVNGTAGNAGLISYWHQSADDGRNVHIYDNFVDGTGTNESTGIIVHSLSSGSASTLFGVRIENNEIHIADATGDVLGIELFCDNLGLLEDFHIIDNEIICPASSTGTFGISLGATDDPIHNGTCRGNVVRNAAIPLETVANCKHITWAHNVVVGGDHSTIDGQSQDCEYITFIGNHFINCADTTDGAIHLLGTSTNTCRHISIIGNHIVNPASWGIECQFNSASPGQDILIEDNFIQGTGVANGEYGIVLSEVDGAIVKGNSLVDWVASGGTSALRISNSDNVTFKSNIFRNVTNRFSTNGTNTYHYSEDLLSTRDTATSSSVAMDLDTRTTELDSTTGFTVTIADGYLGQRKTVVHRTATNNVTLNANVSVTSVVTNAVGESYELEFNGTDWDVIASQGATVTP